MHTDWKTLGWAGAIIAVAITTQMLDLSNSASFGIVASVTGAAVGALSGGCTAGRKCLM